MRTLSIAVLAVSALTGWQALRGGEASGPVRSAYEDSIQRYQGGEAVRHSVAPRQAQPLADGSNASGVEPSYRTANGSDATGVDNARPG